MKKGGICADRKKILIVCGGTGGHVYPAIAVAEELREKFKELAIVFAGRIDGFESRAIRAAGFEMRGIWIRGWERKKILANLRLLLVFPLAFFTEIVNPAPTVLAAGKVNVVLVPLTKK